MGASSWRKLPLMLRALVTVLLLLSVGGFAQTRKATKPAAPSPVDQAEAAIGKQDWGAAEALLKDATSQEPKDYRAWFDLGYVYTAQDKTQEAATAYRHSVDAKSDIF